MSFVPVMMFAILFGLSMDYNVFLLSRIHEAYNEGDRPRESVIHGMARIGKVILFAGLIMSAVFLAFVTQPDVIAKMFGLGLGLAILIDVLIVRLIIAPAVVMLLGDHAWWLPKWLDKILPNVSLEGHLVENVDPKQEPHGRGEAARPLSVFTAPSRPCGRGGRSRSRRRARRPGRGCATSSLLSRRVTWVFTVASLRPSSSASACVGEPAGEPADDVALARGQRDEARLELGAGAALAELLLDQAARDRRGEGVSPAATARTASHSRSGAASLRKKPAAPARSARRTSWSSSWLVTTRMRARLPAATIRFVASMPSRTGILHVHQHDVGVALERELRRPRRRRRPRP